MTDPNVPDGPAAQQPADEAGDGDNSREAMMAMITDAVSAALQDLGARFASQYALVSTDDTQAVWRITLNGHPFSVMANVTP